MINCPICGRYFDETGFALCECQKEPSAPGPGSGIYADVPLDANVAAVRRKMLIRTGRKAIGIEKDPEHFKNAVERIKRELAQGDLFLGQNAKLTDGGETETKT